MTSASLQARDSDPFLLLRPAPVASVRLAQGQSHAMQQRGRCQLDHLHLWGCRWGDRRWVLIPWIEILRASVRQDALPPTHFCRSPKSDQRNPHVVTNLVMNSRPFGPLQESLDLCRPQAHQSDWAFLIQNLKAVPWGAAIVRSDRP